MVHGPEKTLTTVKVSGDSFEDTKYWNEYDVLVAPYLSIVSSAPELRFRQTWTVKRGCETVKRDEEG